ncbi:unnamed protein product, partial [Heterotrigona itama]
MSEDRSDEDPLMDLWYSNWEQQCVEALETEPDYEIQLHNEKELYSQQMWTNSMDSMRRCSELGIEMGRQKRSKEIMNWARKKRRMIRREDLLAYLAGKPPPPRSHSHRSSPKPRMMVCSSSPSETSAPNMVVAPTPIPGNNQDPELHTFREAIALSGSPISRRTGRQAELSAFISSEFARHHKRPASHDVDMGSPTHK